jgi:hypothetical protein
MRRDVAAQRHAARERGLLDIDSLLAVSHSTSVERMPPLIATVSANAPIRSDDSAGTAVTRPTIANSSSYIAAVTFPVCVFCRDG